MAGAADHQEMIKGHFVVLVQKLANDLILIGYYAFYGRYYFFAF